MPTSTSIVTGTTPSAVLQQLQNNYGPQAQAVGQGALNAYAAHLGTFQIVSLIFSLACFGIGIYFLIQTGYLQNRIDRIQDVILKQDNTRKRARASWDDIERHFFAGDDNDLKIAIIEADNLLDETLLAIGVPGAGLGERLQKVTPEKLPNVEDVWQAHKIRNRIAHEAKFVVKRDLADRALTVYEKALENLGLLDAESELGKAHPTEAENRSPK